MDYIVVNGYNSKPSSVLRAHAPLQNYVVNSVGATYIPTPAKVGYVDYTGLHKVVNRYGITGNTGGGGPTIPTYGQIFPSGR